MHLALLPKIISQEEQMDFKTSNDFPILSEAKLNDYIPKKSANS